MKVIVDKASCIGCGACVAIDSKDFKFDDEGMSEAINKEVESVSEELAEAAASCPVNAIKLDDCECDCNPCTCEHCECKKED